MTSRPGQPPGGFDAAGSEDLPDGGCCDLNSEAGHFAVDPAVSPVGVLAGQPTDQALMFRRVAGWPAGLAAHGPGGPAAADDVAVLAQHRVRVDK